MSHDYTFISDLNNNAGMQMQHHQQMSPQGGQMQQMPMQQMPMQQMPMQQANTTDQFNMLRKYLAESAEDYDSDSDSDSENEDYEGGSSGNWQHYYGIATLIMLAIILWYVFKIRREITGMYEEA